MNEKKISKSYDWLRQIPSSLLELDHTPLLGSPPHFPWKEFSQAISKVLQVEDFSLQSKDIQWRPEKELSQGIANPICHHFAVNGLEGSFSWMMSKNEITQLMLELFHEKGSLATLPTDIFAGFHEFLALEALYTLSQVKYDQTLSISLLEQGELPKEAALCIDVEVKCFQKTFLGRLLLSPTFRKSWTERYTPKGNAYLNTDVSDQVNLTVHIEVGSLHIQKSLWSGVHPGDFVVLDDCWFDPISATGAARLLVHGIPIYGGNISKSKIELTEISNFQHVKRQGIVKKMADSKKDPFEEDDFNFETGEFDVSEFDDDLEDSFEESEFTDSEFGFSTTEEKSETELSIEETLSRGRQARVAKAESTPAKEAPAAPRETHVKKDSSHSMFSPDDIPLSVSVEVGRFDMSIKKLVELAPGNLLELTIRPEDGVDLVVNGKCIAKGELLRIGDTLGVRILDRA